MAVITMPIPNGRAKSIRAVPSGISRFLASKAMIFGM
jgi:hypothetical protein